MKGAACAPRCPPPGRQPCVLQHGAGQHRARTRPRSTLILSGHRQFMEGLLACALCLTEQDGVPGLQGLAPPCPIPRLCLCSAPGSCHGVSVTPRFEGHHLLTRPSPWDTGSQAAGRREQTRCRHLGAARASSAGPAAPAQILRPGLLWHFPLPLTCPLNKRQLAVALCACPLLPWAGCVPL